ncbi:MAG: PAS domain S-box protein, partial [Proteobacteria bacterium]|nr:PAS domain S-box protein [Pseudomonadota bacterium]
MKDKAIRLLLVEDDKVDQMAFERYVKKKKLPYDYTIAGSIAEAEKILKSTSFDIVISDYWLGDGVSFELFDLFKELPVIVTTGTGNEEVAVEAMKLGAYDYLIKDPGGNYLKILPATVKLALKRKQNEEELRNYHERLESMVEERTVKLRQSLNREKNLTQIIEKSLNEIYLFDAENYKYLFVNEGARSNMGYSLSEFMEMTPMDIKPEIANSSFTQRVASLKIGQKEKLVYETVHRRKDGSTYPAEVHLQKTEYRARPVFAAIVLDITQRKKMEQRYLELVEGTIDLIIQVDADRNLLYVNHMGKEILGHDPGKLVGKNVFDFIHPDDLETTTVWCENCFNKQIIQSKIENRLVNLETGVVHDMLWTVSFSYDEQGKLLFISGIAHDVTERKQVERAIRKSEKQWDRTFNSFSDIVTLHDTDLRIVKANQAACAMLASPCDEIIGYHCYELFHGSEEPCPGCPLVETKKSLVPCSREMYYGKLGKTFLVTAAPVFDDLGELEYIARVGKDISDLKNLEKKLAQSQKMEAIGTMAGGIAHDFNNILSAILGYAEFIREDVSAESEIGKNIAEVLAAGKRATNLVRQILTFSCQAGIEKQVIHPHLVVREA